MTTIPESVRTFLASGPLGHVVTLDSDGTPHISLAWVGLEGDRLIWASFTDQHKLDNLRRDPRISISFQAHESGGELLHPYVVIKGRARLTPGGALGLMDQLAPLYIGPGQRFPLRDMPAGITVHVDVEQIYGMGPWRREVAQSE